MRYKLGKTRKPPVSIITKQAINDFRNICNHGKDSFREAELKIERDYMLGRVVEVFHNGFVLIQYYDLFIKVDKTIVMGVYRNKDVAREYDTEYGKFEKNQKKYDKFNKRYRL